MPAAAFAQAQAANGNIEGTVRDSSGGVLPGVAVTVHNTDTGARRTVITNESGVYRAVLLPLGTYTISAELEGFHRSEQTGLRLSAGQTLTIDVVLSVGGLTETVSVTVDTPVRIEANKPDTKIETWTAEVGGPVLRDRLHFFGGFESTYRDLSGQSTITIRPEDAQRIGLSAQPPAIPSSNCWAIPISACTRGCTASSCRTTGASRAT